MIAADYRCDMRVDCRTCDVVGSMSNVGSLVVMQTTRRHRDCDVTFDFTNVMRTRDRIAVERKRRKAVV